VAVGEGLRRQPWMSSGASDAIPAITSSKRRRLPGTLLRMSRGLLTQIARYPRHVGQDEAENRLTEVFAAVLSHAECRGLPEFVVAGWLREAASSPRLANRTELARLAAAISSQRLFDVRISTQVAASAGGRKRRPDLQISLTNAVQEILIWVEVKHGIAPHSGQLHDYLLAQQERGIRHGAVLLIAPRADYPFSASEIPDTVPQLTWQRTASRLGDFGPKPLSDAGCFLIRELQQYLREEGLMDPERVTPEHLVAFAHHREAFSALELVTEEADAFVAQFWTEPEPKHHDSYGKDLYRRSSWWSYPMREAHRDVLPDWGLDWNLFRDARAIFPEGRPGVPRFTAGASADSGELAKIDPDAADRLRALGFELTAKERLSANGWDRIWRCAYPEEVLAGSTIEAQGEALGRWVVESFELLVNAVSV
jgi:hypothetical protein